MVQTQPNAGSLLKKSETITGTHTTWIKFLGGYYNINYAVTKTVIDKSDFTITTTIGKHWQNQYAVEDYPIVEEYFNERVVDHIAKLKSK